MYTCTKDIYLCVCVCVYDEACLIVDYMDGYIYLCVLIRNDNRKWYIYIYAPHCCCLLFSGALVVFSLHSNVS